MIGERGICMNDQQIVELYFQRNEKAIEESQNKYGHYCFNIAYNILFDHEDSQECVNDTFLGAWNSIPPHKPVFLNTYLGKITRRLSIDILRSKNTKKRGRLESTVSFDELEEMIPDEKSIQMETGEITQILNTFLEGLSISDRKVFVCRYWYNESIKEISQRFHFSESKVKMSLKRNRDKLKEILIKEGVF